MKKSESVWKYLWGVKVGRYSFCDLVSQRSQESHHHHHYHFFCHLIFSRWKSHFPPIKTAASSVFFKKMAETLLSLISQAHVCGITCDLSMHVFKIIIPSGRRCCGKLAIIHNHRWHFINHFVLFYHFQSSVWFCHTSWYGLYFNSNGFSHYQKMYLPRDRNVTVVTHPQQIICPTRKITVLHSITITSTISM